jgi:protein SMG8
VCGGPEARARGDWREAGGRGGYSTNHDDFQLIKDFIFRQSDALRGRGGYSSNASVGSVAGVGMVAAAAAAVSAASGKPVNAPNLPTFDKWLSISTSILIALLSGRNMLRCQSESKTHASPTEKNGQLPVGSNAIEITLSCLESNNGLNMKFPSSWCQRVLPADKEVDIPERFACLLDHKNA